MLPASFFHTSPNAALQSAGFLSPLAHVLSFLGREEFFLLLLPIIYGCFSRRTGVRLGALLLSGEALNVALKVLLALPRPYWVDPNIKALSTDPSFGLPSSHAQNAAAVWPFLARGRSLGLRIGAALLVVGIALSRVFLGVHFVGDVVAGVLLGTIVLWVFTHFSPRIERWFEAQNALRQAIFALGVSALMIAVFAVCQALAPSRVGESWARFSDADAGAKAIVGYAGAMCGLLIGAGMCARRGLFTPASTWAGRAAWMLVALIGVAFFWRGLALVLPREPMWAECLGRFVRYAGLAWWIADGAPRLFERRGVKSRAEAPSSST